MVCIFTFDQTHETYMNTIRKRSRSISPSTSVESSSSTSSSLPSIPTPLPSSPKHKTIKTTTTDNFICSLKPICNRNNSIHNSIESLKNHELTYHTFICQFESTTTNDNNNNNKGKGKDSELSTTSTTGKCGRVFPSARYLQLHTQEIHDPSFLLSLQNNEKPYECYLPPTQCLKKFSSPKKRRLHLISKHFYPKEFYFDLTLWGLEGINKTGIGGGLIRDVWKAPEVAEGRLGIQVEEEETGKDGNEDRGTIEFIRDLAPHLALSTSSITTSSLASKSIMSEEEEDTTMEDLTNSLAKTKIQLDLIPRSVKLALKSNKMKSKSANQGIVGDMEN